MAEIIVPAEIIKQLEDITQVQACLITGSRAVGKNAPNSDWDFFMLIEQSGRSWRKTWRAGTTWIEVFCETEAQIRSYFAHDVTEGRGMALGMFATGQIVWDNPAGTLAALTHQARQLWQRGPDALTSTGRLRIDYTIATLIQDIEDCLHLEEPADLLINQALGEFVQCYYRLSCRWLPRPKDRLADLTHTASGYGMLVERVGRSGNWRERAALVITIGRKLADQFGLSLSGEFYQPPQ